MSILFGVCQIEDHTVVDRQLTDLAQPTNRYALDGTFVRANGRIGMGFQPYRSHQRSGLESQPLVDARGNMLTLDGRIDNYKELCRLLDHREKEIADSRIVLAAFERWGESCFSRIIGDWALALWSQSDRTLYLARDHAGTRTLYFEATGERILWSTHIETFFADKNARGIDEEYVSCYLACQPTRDLTAHKGIKAVTPAHFLVFCEGKTACRPHWSWLVKEKIRFRTDAEYEERFLALFRQSIERRTGPGAPILAQLSGGMDSTSIVCMSDHIRTGEGGASSGLLDTISFFDDMEPHWNELPYFSLVESKRGKSGFHVKTSFTKRSFEVPESRFGVYLQPGADSASVGQEQEIGEILNAGNYRSILSGIGGDEVLGGFPNALPELGDLLVSGHLIDLTRRILDWCVADRIPVFHRLFATAAFVYRLYGRPLESSKFPGWLSHRLQRLCMERERKDFVGHGHWGFSPAAVHNSLTWWTLLETMPHLKPGLLVRREYRYPYLDRDLVEFLFRIPQNQLLLPGRRRALMRRALKGIVPDEVLERKRKAYIVRGPLAMIDIVAEKIDLLLNSSFLAQFGFVDANRLRTEIDLIRSGKLPGGSQAVLRALALELWLRHVAGVGVALSPVTHPQSILFPKGELTSST
jgi:asparagine synthase (glutamine-hydrolysing)